MKKSIFVLVVLFILIVSTTAGANFNGFRELKIEKQSNGNPYKLAYVENITYHIIDDIRLNVNIDLFLNLFDLNTLTLSPVDMNVTYSLSKWDFILGGTFSILKEKGDPKSVYLGTRYNW